MAIGPEKLTQNFLNELVHLEHYFDKQLATKRIAPGGHISLTFPSHMTEEHFGFLKGRYLTAGWKDVVMERDQRDGDFITFKN